MTNHAFRVFAIAIFCGGFIGSASAGTLVQTFATDNSADRSAWEAAVGSFLRVDFSSVTVTNQGFPFGYKINAPGGEIRNDAGTLTYQGAQERYQDNANGTGATRSVFSPTVLAAGLFVDLNPQTVGTGLKMIVYFEDDSTQSIDILNNTTDGNSSTAGFDGFVGFVADMPVAEFRLYENNQTDLGMSESYVGDDVVFATNEAPEPTAGALAIVAGLILTGQPGGFRSIRLGPVSSRHGTETLGTCQIRLCDHHLRPPAGRSSCQFTRRTVR